MANKYLIGTMQGRLLPKYKQRYQSHPVGYWEKEFILAKSLNIDSIEFIIDYENVFNNPLMTTNGLDQIIKISNKTNVPVKSICADYFMTFPLHSSSKIKLEERQLILNKLIINSTEIGVKDIVIPLVDNSSMMTDISKQEFIKTITPCVKLAEKYKINLALETDLSPEDFFNFLKKLPYKYITVNYDTGNSASYGYSLHNEFDAYGDRISNIHIKDRILGGGSVMLGTGNANFDDLKKELFIRKYTGILIMQAYRDDEGISCFKKQFSWIKTKLNINKTKHKDISYDYCHHSS